MNNTTKPEPVKSSWRKRLWVVILLIALPVLLVVWIAVQAWFETPRVIATAETSGRMTLQPEALPQNFLDALLKVEDPNFHQHNGVDLHTPGAGWTTITQALVKI
jgi:membrane carboxypeptidase/penicillin-binding protein PbpC